MQKRLVPMLADDPSKNSSPRNKAERHIRTNMPGWEQTTIVFMRTVAAVLTERNSRGFLSRFLHGNNRSNRKEVTHSALFGFL